MGRLFASLGRRARTLTKTREGTAAQSVLVLSVSLAGLAGCSVPPAPDADGVLMASAFARPIVATLPYLRNGEFPFGSANQGADGSCIAARLVDTKALAIGPSNQPPYWGINSSPTIKIDPNAVQATVGTRRIVGHTNVRRFKQLDSQFYAVTVSYEIDHPGLSYGTDPKSSGPFTFVAVLLQNPATGEWGLVEEPKVDRQAEYAALFGRLNRPDGTCNAGPLIDAIAEAKVASFKGIAKGLADRGLAAPGPYPSTVLTGNKSLIWYTRPQPTAGRLLSEMDAVCAATPEKRVTGWRAPTDADLGTLTEARPHENGAPGTDLYFNDAPDERFFGPLAGAPGTGHRILSSSLYTYNGAPVSYADATGSGLYMRRTLLRATGHVNFDQHIFGNPPGHTIGDGETLMCVADYKAGNG